MMIALILALAISNVNAEVALVIGGFGASDSVQVITKDDVCLGTEASPRIPRAPDGRVGWTAQYIDGRVVVCGGAKVDFYANCYSFKIGEGSWSDDGTMAYRKRYAESIAFNGEMIVLGGYNQNQGWLDVVERRQSNGQFVEMTDWKMPRKIFDFCAVQMDEDRIMVLGGNILGLFDSEDMDILNTKTNTWSKGPPMAKSRATHDCMLAEHNGENGVMVTGGCSQNCFYHLEDTSFFSFVTETWTELPQMNVGRMGHKMLMMDGKPMVIGGFDAGELDSIEIFDGTSWTLHTKKLPFADYVFATPDEIPDTVTCK